MTIFKTTKFTWWQIGMLKWAVLFSGIAVGATWPDLFVDYATILATVGLLMGVYLGVVWMRTK